MRQAEIRAMAATLVLLAIALMLFIGGLVYSTWATVLSLGLLAGGLGAAGQALLAGLAWWGLRLARQQAELAEGPVALPGSSLEATRSGFRMSMGDDDPAVSTTVRGDQPEVRTLDAGFQRMVVGLSAATLLVLVGVVIYLMMHSIGVRPVGKPAPVPALDPLAVLMAVGSLAGYIAAYRFSRKPAEVRASDWLNYGDAVSGMLLMGLPGMAAVGAAVLAEWFGAANAGLLAAGFVSLMLLVQALELLVNSMRNYQGVEELDQAPVDLGATPLVPMLTSSWATGLKAVVAQSLGVARVKSDGERSIIARMMPRVLVALAVLAILASTIRVVRPGEVAIRERLGYASEADIEDPLQPGLHITMPWPIDELVRIPTEAVQRVQLGQEDEGEKIGGVEARFWLFRHGEAGQTQDQVFMTGDLIKLRIQPPADGAGVATAPAVGGGEQTSAQLVGAVIDVWWKVKPVDQHGPSDFYRTLSHSEFLEHGASVKGAQVRPIFEALIQQIAAHAATKAFGRHTLDDVMEGGRRGVEEYCRSLVQQELDALHVDNHGHGAGIEVVDLIIREVHPPIGIGRKQTATGEDALGPAAAYEEVVRARENMERTISMGRAYKIEEVNKAESESAQILADARAYRAERVEGERANALRRRAWSEAYAADKQQRGLVRTWLGSRALNDVLPGMTKIMLGPDVTPPDIWQPNSKDAGRTLGPAVPGGT